MATYEVWLTNGSGHRLDLLENLFFLNYTRTLRGLGTISFGVGYDDFRKKFNPFFLPDWRVEVWRSSGYGIPLRREDVFLLRKPNVYTRGDGVQIIQFYGRNGLDLLFRRSVIQRANTSYTSKTDYADDMIKEIVREQMLYGSARDEEGVVDNTRAWPQNEFLVQSDHGLGPTLTRNFADRKVIDILRELQDATFQENAADATKNRIYFEVAPHDFSNHDNALDTPLGWEFRTSAKLYGIDRTQSLEFSVENENLKDPSYALNHLEEITAVIVKGNGTGTGQQISTVEDAARVDSSRWNRVEKIISASNATSAGDREAAGKAELYKGQPSEELTAIILNTPGSKTTPRSLYRVDWDLGDLVTISYAGLQKTMEINTIYVAMDENGKEEITGRNAVQ